MKILVPLLVMQLLTTLPSFAGEKIGYLEDFALSPDRAATLSQLVPGTPDFYYYKALDEQNRGELDAVDATLTQWVERHGDSPRVEELRNRQALLRYSTDPESSLEYLRKKLNLRFDHQRQAAGAKADLPTALDPKLIAPETLLAEARRRSKTLAGVDQSGLRWILFDDIQLSAAERRDLLSRIELPDAPHLVELILADLATKESQGFGEFPIHGNLLKAQLDELWKAKPDLIDDEDFIRTYLVRLQPPDTLDWHHRNDTRRAYLARLWDFAAKLSPAQNSLKASLFYQRLVFDRAEGVYDKSRFIEYIKLPRQVFYIEPRFLQRESARGSMADLGKDYAGWQLFPPIGTDDELIRSYLAHFFETDQSYETYRPYIREIFLKEVFAETKILNGIGDAEKWVAMLQPAQFQALKDRVDLEFAYTNPQLYKPDQPVSLKVAVKNVPKLIVKTYRINTLNYYLSNTNELGTDLDLDGLVANEETTHEYSEPPLRRVERTYDFPDLTDKRGTWVVEFIGNGRSSRALVRKGELYAVPRPGAAGTVLTVFNEADERVKNASAWFGGREFKADADGEIAIPFSVGGGEMPPVVLTDGAVSSLRHIALAPEQYELRMRAYVDREQLLAGAQAKVAVRGSLRVGESETDPDLLENVKFTIEATTIDGIATTREYPDFKLYADRESVAEFRVPARCASLVLKLEGDVVRMDSGKTEHVASLPLALKINEIDRTAQIRDVFLSRDGADWIVETLGRSGESRSDQVVQLELKHRDFAEPARMSLKTDAAGRVRLGGLSGIERVAASAGGQRLEWTLLGDRHTLTAWGERVVAKAGDTIRIPYMGKEAKATRGELSLLEWRGGNYADRFDAMTLKDGYVEIAGLDAGEFYYRIAAESEPVWIVVEAGEARDGFVFGEEATRELANVSPIQIRDVKRVGDDIAIQLANAGEGARVQVVADRFAPVFDLFGMLAEQGRSPLGSVHEPTESFYVSGRNLGDEYRYVLERAYAAKFPGNMLSRPGLLLNPWALRATETGVQDAQLGEEYARKSQLSRGGRGVSEDLAYEPLRGQFPEFSDFSDLEFLKTPSRVQWNLVPDGNGVVRVKVADLAGRHHIHVLATDSENSVYRELVLDGLDTDYRDIRLADALDPAENFTQDKTISLLKEGDRLVVKDPRSAEFEVYDSVGKLFDLYRTLNGDATLAEFSFVANWPSLKPEEKREKYSKYASHELSFFLSLRDPEFFRKVVEPYLRNKKDKTFLDRYLVGDDLTAYLQPWEHERLNIVERILLGRRIEAELEPTRRMVRELCDLIPPDPERFDRLFQTALRGRALTESPKRMAGVAGSRFESRIMEEAEPEADLSIMADAIAAPMPAEAAKQDHFGSLAKDKAHRAKARPFYQKLEKTREWAENNYYQRPIAEQDYSLVPADRFWDDFARWDGQGAFLSEHVAEASRNFTETLFALAVTGLPFEAGEHKSEEKDGSMTLTAASPAIVFHKEIAKAPVAEEKTPILVSENFFRLDDRYRHENNEQLDKFVTDEFLVDVVYGGQVVVTNPTSAPQRLDLLVQIPEHAIPVQGSDYTTSRPFVVGPYATQKIEYFFYFPESGEAAHYPAHVSKGGDTIASGEAFTFHVVKTLSSVDKESWEYLSQNGSDDEVLAYLRTHNLRRTDLARIAWRMRDAAFFKRTTELLRGQFAYDGTLWSYGLMHNDLPTMRQWLLHADAFLGSCGAWLESEPVTIDPVARRAYQFLEYKPLVNARTHPLGAEREIQNEALFAQYRSLLQILSCKPSLDDEDLMSATYYLLLQDRVGEALKFFGRVNAEALPERLQHDYFSAYLAFYRQEPDAAKAIAAKYGDYPVDRWRELFAQVTGQIAEMDGGEQATTDEEDREQRQGQLAATEPTFEMKIEAGEILIDARNLPEVTVNFYRMDLELLFSTNPFLEQDTARFSLIEPNRTEMVKVASGGAVTRVPIPDEFEASNVLVEVVGGGQRKALAHYANTLDVQIAESYGRIQVTADGKPLPIAYVKVYARMRDGEVKFYKDGYTDLRGKFDYTSLNTDELPEVERFALLVMSEKHGAVVREVAPPQR